MIRKVLLCSAAALLAAGCQDGTNARVATAVAVAPGSVSLDAVGATRVVRAAVSDQNGQAMTDAALTWTSSSAAVSVAGAGGDSAIVTAVGNGSATITATSGSASGTASVAVAQVATNLQKAGGDAQTGAAGSALGTPLQVLVRDRLGAPVAGVTVLFSVMGGGSLTATSGVSGANGVVSVGWTLGTQTGLPQQVFASASGASGVDFNATVVAGPAAAATVLAGNNQSATPGSAVAVAPRLVVRDAFGNPAAGVNVQFTVTAGGGTVTGGTTTTAPNGEAAVGAWTLGAAGPQTLTATFPGTAVPAVVFTATAGAVGTITIQGGDNQAAMVGAAVPNNPTVVVRNGSGQALAGVTVTFTITSGGGTVTNPSVVTNASGVASAGSWVMGAEGGPNRLTASVSSLAATPVVFRGVGCAGGGAGYSLTLCFTTPMSTSQRAAFTNAAARWASVITADLPDVSGSVPASSCGTGSPSATLTFDDLVIFAGIENIDGPGQVLGSAGPCFIRTGSSLPLLGVMRFDLADVNNLEAAGQFGSVILHEMGHVIGVGTLWSTKGLLQNPSTGSAAADTWFSGANGLEGFNNIGGATYTGGQKVPVENTGGQGTMNSHWRESVLANELMTGYLNSGVANPMSQLTVRSLIDLGYTVNVSAADAFSLTLSLRAGGSTTAPSIRLHNDIYTGPLYTMDRQGRLTRIRN